MAEPVPGFERAFTIVIDIEDGYVNDPADPGGETRYGISKRSYPNEDIANLTVSRAMDIYREDYWRKCNCDSIKWPLSLFLFDTAVNQGGDFAIRMLQKVLGVRQDGVFGQLTLLAANRLGAEGHALFLAERGMQYIRTDGFLLYGKGWFKRLFIVALAA